MTVRFVMIGGFLGAGKTTTVSRLARLYQSQGKRVGVVTNDQAHDLVDTNTLRAQGLAVEEVPGACFCCRFDDLVGRVGALQTADRPDVILAEPVGSCTDLVATVIQPLKDLYAGRFEVAPYAVLFKPSHGIRILKNQSAGGFSPKAAYIFKKQLEEADAIVINRIDELDPPRAEELSRLVAEHFPGTPVLRASATTGAGFEALAELLDQRGGFGRKLLDIDYDTYAEGEAELGWLNATARLHGAAPFDLDALLTAVLGELADACRALGGEVAHLKLIGMDDAGAFAVGNVISSDTAPKLSLPSGLKPREAELIVNARVAIDPTVLEAEVKRVVAAQAARAGVTAEFRTSQSLRPGRPVPTHRYTEAK
ncbi:GTP-binding protein [Frigoriglobus tundricola]|uniref:Metal chaperone, involved in Zn homeostasis n=1 Tax=Frigoriglobus tundricola TaxID=2774151 RepID=A0A6M5YY46_9BACT|nr:GTP-binding protein [Frigoriglobus tundricola]QJW98915.1 Metal chaperone, involved in Zn homeostasis [Frigoriglobus tundricola]